MQNLCLYIYFVSLHIYTWICDVCAICNHEIISLVMIIMLIFHVFSLFAKMMHIKINSFNARKTLIHGNCQTLIKILGDSNDVPFGRAIHLFSKFKFKMQFSHQNLHQFTIKIQYFVTCLHLHHFKTLWNKSFISLKSNTYKHFFYWF